MNQPNPEKLTSKALRSGGMLRLLDFAVRGIPTHHMPGEQRIDRSWAIEVYWPELQQLDGLGIHPKWFSSGVAGAALVSLALWPGSLELWRRVRNHHIRHDQNGADAACLIVEMVQRHQEIENLTRLPKFQFYLFQQSLAVAEVCARQKDYARQMRQLPPVPDIVELLDRVRELKSQRHMMAGFRPTGILRKWWVTPRAPEIAHTASMEHARALAQAAAMVKGWSLKPAALDYYRNKLAKHSSPSEFRHPAALAAAMVTMAQNDSCWPLWKRALSGQSYRLPAESYGSLKDTATRMQDSIISVNRSKSTVHSAARLFNRLLNAVKLWHAHGDQIRQYLPKAPKRDPELESVWIRLDVVMTPEYSFDNEIKLPSIDDLDDVRPGSRKVAKKSARRRLQTGRTAEQWVMKHYQSLTPEFAGLKILDCRETLEGYDFALGSGPERLFVEVKGVRGSIGPIVIGDRQWREAHRKGRNYYLVVVFNVASDNPTCKVIHDPASVLNPECHESLVRIIHWTVEGNQLVH